MLVSGKLFFFNVNARALSTVFMEALYLIKIRFVLHYVKIIFDGNVFCFSLFKDYFVANETYE